MKKRIILISICIIILISTIGIIVYLLLPKEESSDIDKMDNFYVEQPKKDVEVNKNETKDEYADLKKEKYYVENNLDRYKAYIALYPEKDMEEVVRCVNSNIDNEFYTNVIDADLSKKELILVNKYNKLETSYTPEVVEMDERYSQKTLYKYMEPTAYEHFKQMVDDAEKENIILYNVSAYRSSDVQSILYNNYVNRDGVEAADRYSARPGYSEHQTGLATDIITSDSIRHFEDTMEYSWLIENSYKYGFILRYPQDKEYITGYKFEPWHYRYVGEYVAKYIHENDITYEEYYEYFIKNNNNIN